MTQEKSSSSPTFLFDVLQGFGETQSWLGEVCQAADTHRNELGFLARSVYEQFARRDGLYVLVAKTLTSTEYAGHLLFDRHFPRAHVRQMFIAPRQRRRGAASHLLNCLRESLTKNCFISIYARVAEDLVEANSFWHRQRFYVQRSEIGGASRDRKILVRCHELESPQLFPTSGVNEHNPLGIVEAQASDLPMYLLDMNVLFDVQPRRLRRKEVVRLFQAERMNFCRLAISDEVLGELKRNLQTGKTDPMEAYVETFPCVPVKPVRDSDKMFSDLAKMVFPEASGQRALNANERSDLRHVITAVQHDLAGLITSDVALLNAGPSIAHAYRVQVVSPSAFELNEFTERSYKVVEADQETTLRLLSVSASQEAAVRALLSQTAQLSGSAIAGGWLPIENNARIAVRCAAWIGERCIGYITWPAIVKTDSLPTVRAAVDESHPRALETARVLLRHLIDSLCSKGPHQVQLDLPNHQSYLREVGAGLGFVVGRDGRHLIKSMLGAVLTPATWTSRRATLITRGGPHLPSIIPVYTGVDQQIVLHTPDGNRVHVALDRLESLLAPTLLCLPGRPAIVSPIRRSYAESLLGHSAQGSLLPGGSASLHTDRIYLSQPSCLKYFKRGTLMFFYESGKYGGRSQIVAVTRVRQAYLRACDALGVSDLQQSVLTPANLNEIGKSAMKAVAVFDNIFTLPQPIELQTLKRLGYGRPNDLITTHTISDRIAQEILAEGFGRA